MHYTRKPVIPVTFRAARRGNRLSLCHPRSGYDKSTLSRELLTVGGRAPERPSALPLTKGAIMAQKLRYSDASDVVAEAKRTVNL